MDWSKVKTGRQLCQFIRDGVLKLDPDASVCIGPTMDLPDRVVGTVWVNSTVKEQVIELLSKQYGCLVSSAETDDFVFFFGTVFDLHDSFPWYEEKCRKAR